MAVIASQNANRVVLRGLKAGTTVISAAYLEKQYTCKVTVDDQGIVTPTPTPTPDPGQSAELKELLAKSHKLYGYRYTIRQGADYIFQTDSDGQTNPAEFEPFWELRNQYDAIIGDRSARQDGASRVFVESTLLLILKSIFGVKVPDANAPFRLMKKELTAKYIQKMPEDFNLPNVMLTTYFAYYHENIRFLEISFKPRQGGKNSLNIKKITKIGWKALADFKNLRKQM